MPAVRRPTQPEAIIKARGLRKKFQQFTAVAGLDLDIQAGESFGILGPNGAGKTTTLNMLMGRSDPSAGELKVFGQSYAHARESIRQAIGVVPQIDNLDPDFSVIENLQVYARFFGIDRATQAQRIPELLEFVELSARAKHRVDTLSGGMQRRLTLARALINDPELLILDEPTTGLDPQVRHLMWARLRELTRNGKTLILTSHYMEEAQRLCDRILIIDHGQAIALDSPEQLIRQHVERQVLEIHGLPADHCQQLSAHLNTPVRLEIPAHDPQAGIRLYSDDLSPILAQLEQQTSNYSYQHRPSNLEDVFLKLTGHGLREQSH